MSVGACGCLMNHKNYYKENRSEKTLKPDR